MKVKDELLFSSHYVNLSFLIKEWQENTYYYQISCSLSSMLCLQESQAFWLVQ